MIFLWHWVGEGKAIKYAYFNTSINEISENNLNKVLSAVSVLVSLDEAKNPLNEYEK